MDLITKQDTCYLKATNTGYGLETYWQLSGQQSTYTGTLSGTDGYKIVASVVWKDMFNES